MCGSCWTFSAVSVLESSYAIKYGELIKLSEQQFVDCTKESYGCDGGYVPAAFNFGGSSFIAYANSYKYKGFLSRFSKCK